MDTNHEQKPLQHTGPLLGSLRQTWSLSTSDAIDVGDFELVVRYNWMHAAYHEPIMQLGQSFHRRYDR